MRYRITIPRISICQRSPQRRPKVHPSQPGSLRQQLGAIELYLADRSRWLSEAHRGDAWALAIPHAAAGYRRATR